MVESEARGSADSVAKHQSQETFAGDVRVLPSKAAQPLHSGWDQHERDRT